MNARFTRRDLAAGFLALMPLPAVADSHAVTETVTVASLIRAHRDALTVEHRAVAEYNRAFRDGSPALATIREKRDALRKARHSARRALRRVTPQNGEEFALLSDYCRGLVPSPDPQDVAGTCRRDLDAARKRMGRARA